MGKGKKQHLTENKRSVRGLGTFYIGERDSLKKFFTSTGVPKPITGKAVKTRSINSGKSALIHEKNTEEGEVLFLDSSID